MFKRGKKKQQVKKLVFWVCTYKNGRRLLRKVVPNDPIQPDVHIRLTHLLSSSRSLNTIMRINTRALFYVKGLLSQLYLSKKKPNNSGMIYLI